MRTAATQSAAGWTVAAKGGRGYTLLKGVRGFLLLPAPCLLLPKHKAPTVNTKTQCA